MRTGSQKQEPTRKKLYFRLHGYSAVHAPRGKQNDIEVDRPRLNQIQKAYKKMF